MNAAEARKLEARDRQREPGTSNDESIPANVSLPESDVSTEGNTTRRTPKMSDYLRKPDIFKVEGNLSENWRRWKRSYDCYFDAAELHEKTDKVKINTFLNIIGPDAVDIFDSFNLPEVNRTVYDNVVKAFDEFCKPKQNTVYERFVFNERKQKEGEPFDTFHMDIKRLVRTCKYGDQENDMLRDRIVIGVCDKRLQTRLLETVPLSYETAVEKCRTSEVTKEQANEMSKLASVSEVKHVVDNKHRKQRTNDSERRQNNNNNGYNRNSNGADNRNTGRRDDNRRRNNNTNTKANHSQSNNNKNSTNTTNRIKFIDACKFCSLSHQMGSRHCPAYGKTCNSCNKKNHYSSVCRAVDAFSAANCSSEEYDFDDNEEFCISSLDKVDTEVTNDAISYPWLEKIQMKDNKETACKVDTGAEVDVMTWRVLKRMFPEIELQKTNMTLRAFGGQKVRPMGTCTLLCRLNSVSLMIKFAVVDLDITPILSLKSCIRFKLVNPTRSRIFRNSNRINNRNL